MTMPSLSETLSVDIELSATAIRAIALGIAAAIAWGLGRALPGWIGGLLDQSGFPRVADAYRDTVAPNPALPRFAAIALLADLVLNLVDRDAELRPLETTISALFCATAAWFACRLFSSLFDTYFLDTAVKQGKKLNSELLLAGRVAVYGTIVVVAVLGFAETHDIDAFGLLAGLGVGGLAIAFAAQKTLEQLLGGIVLYLDRPFVVDDYVGLPDGTFGRVEAIGLRSTKIRISGKGTLVVVPNSTLAGLNVENFSGAKKVLSIIYLNFHQEIPEGERALVARVIRDSTDNILGLDTQSTDINFRSLNRSELERATQVQITFFILGSGEVSLDLRRQLLDLANQNLTDRLQTYGLDFEVADPAIYVDSPIAV